MLLFLTLIDNPEEASFLEGLYHAHYRLLYGQALRVLRHPQDAEDAVQSAMMRLAKKVPLLMGLQSNKLLSYLVITVRNTAINQYRQREKTQAHMVDQPLETVEDSTFMGPEAQVVDQAAIAHIKQAIRQLPPREKDALMLRYFHHMTDTEIAYALGVKAVSARVLLSRGRQRLQKMLQEGRDEDAQQPSGE